MPDIVNALEKLTADKQMLFSALLELTYHCNLRCFHCYNTPRKLPELTTVQWKRVLKALADLKCLYLTFSGGEALARKDFFEIAFFAQQLNYAISIFSNGTLIDKKVVKKLSELAPIDIGISLYSADERIHDNITRTPGSFRKTVSGIRLLRKNGIRTRVKCLLCKRNIGGYKQVIALAKSLGADYEFDPVLTPARGGDKSILSDRLDRSELQMLLSDKRVFFSDPDYGKIPEDYRLQILCSAGVTTCSITPYGDVFPCVQLDLKAGNVLKTPLKSIWAKSKVFKALRKTRNTDLNPCWECHLKVYCGRCPGIALSEDGDLLGRSEVACLQAEVAERVVKRRGSKR